MKSAFEQMLRRVRLRWNGNLLLEKLAWSLAGAGAAAALAVATDRVFSLGIFRPWELPLLAGLAAILAAGLWYRRRPKLLHVAARIDGELGLKERMSTALALGQSQDPFAVAACVEARRAVQTIDLKGKFPLRMSRHWLWTSLAWAAAAAAILFLPPLDILGRGRAAASDQERKTQLEQARSDVQKAVEKIDVSVRQLADASLSADLAKAADAKNALKAEDVKHEAIRKLGELADKIKKVEQSPKMDSAKLLGDMLKEIRPPAQSLLPELNRDIAKGDFKAAGELLREIQKKLEEGKLTKDQQEQLAKQLTALGKQLEELAARDKDLQEELKKAGLNGDLAKLDEQALKEALAKSGLSQEKIEELLKKAQACRSACAACSKLGQGMKACSSGEAGEGEGVQLSPEELAKLLEDLSAAEGDAEQEAMAKMSLEEIDAAIECLGEGAGEWKEGLALTRSRGSGGPGIGMGPRDADKTGETSTVKTQANVATKDGPIVASWLYKGPQVKGESQKKLQEVIQAGKDAAAEAINENEIPRKYEGPVKQYFGDLEKTGKDGNQ